MSGRPTMRHPGGVTERIDYGEHPDQYAELTRPQGDPRGVVVVIHGGFWRERYDLSLGRPLAQDLAARGWAAWNLEYRRVGGAGGTPETFDDVSAGIDALAATGLDLSRVVTLGHSAGGHLAAWAAGRRRTRRWGEARVAVTHVIAQGAVLDLSAAHRDRLGDGAVGDLVGGAPEADLDPARQLPVGVPVWAVHGREDDIVPPRQARTYVAAVRAAGGEAEVVEVDGDHFCLIDVTHPAWDAQVAILEGIARG